MGFKMCTVIFYQTNIIGETALQPVLTGAEKEEKFTGQSCVKYLPVIGTN